VQGSGTHIAFHVPDHQAVDAFYQAGLKAGVKDNGGPGPRPDYSQTYYAAFLIDPTATTSKPSAPEPGID